MKIIADTDYDDIEKQSEKEMKAIYNALIRAFRRIPMVSKITNVSRPESSWTGTSGTGELGMSQYLKIEMYGGSLEIGIEFYFEDKSYVMWAEKASFEFDAEDSSTATNCKLDELKDCCTMYEEDMKSKIAKVAKKYGYDRSDVYADYY